jgi:hypothetical protein
MSNDVGYKRPPREKCWKKGQSGNPSGRPKGSKNFATAMAEVLREPQTVTVDGEEKTVTRLEAFVRTMVESAIDGDPRHSAQLLNVIHDTEAKQEKAAASETLAPADRKVLDILYARLAQDAEAKNKG